MEAVLCDAPRALATRDTVTHLYPFMLAAVGDDADLATVYLLLRKNPMLARGLAADFPWAKTAKLKEEVSRLEDENVQLRKENTEHVRENQRMRSEMEKLRMQISHSEMCQDQIKPVVLEQSKGQGLIRTLKHDPFTLPQHKKRREL